MSLQKMQIEPVRKTSVVQSAISKIKELIDQEYFKFGEKLPPERELAKLLGISLPSLREALRALSILGIAEMRPGSGTYLRSSMSDWSSDPFSLLFHLSKPIHIDLFEARMGIEGIIAELAAKKRTEEDLQAMEATLRKMRTHLEDKMEYIRYEIEFHQAVIRAAKNTILEDFMEKMYKVLYESRKRTVEQLKDVYRDSYLEHYQIYRHIKEGDPKKARKAMVDNLTKVDKRFREDREKSKNGISFRG
ncbi:MAG TPA: FadR/GntR family transcriptional regulator [Thermodesulfobacteriota bacterium]|nr:FadR/GntR family transcriptional regulator [Thermodesulfobacteriota bacterium]